MQALPGSAARAGALRGSALSTGLGSPPRRGGAGRGPSLSGKQPALTPKVAVRIAFLGATVIALLTLLLLRLWFLQVIGGEQYARAADDNRLREVVLEAPRGIIEDRRGRVLVGNRAGQNVVMIPQELGEGPRRERVLRRLARVLHVPVAELHETIDTAKRAKPPRTQ